MPTAVTDFWYEHDGLRLHGELDPGPHRDSAPLALILPGFWRRAASPVFAPLTAALHRRGLRVLRIEFRGHGESTGTFTFGDRESDDFAALLALLDARGEKAAELWSLSMGGTTAALALAGMAEAGRWPAALRRWVLISAPAGRPAVKWDWFTPATMRQLRAREAMRPPRFNLAAFPGRERTLAAARRAGAEAAARDTRMTAFHCATDWLIPAESGGALYAALGPACAAHFIPDERRLHADALVRAHLAEMVAVVGGAPAPWPQDRRSSASAAGSRPL